MSSSTSGLPVSFSNHIPKDPFDVISTRASKGTGSSDRRESTGQYEQKLSVIEGLVGSQIKSMIPARAQTAQAPFFVVLFYLTLSTLIAFAREDFVNVSQTHDRL